jgi:hypothetical protein
VWAAVLLWLAEGVGIISRPLSRRVVRSFGTLKVGSFSPVWAIVGGVKQHSISDLKPHYRLAGAAYRPYSSGVKGCESPSVDSTPI